MDVSDAFSKLREQILVYDNPESNLERTGGLNLVNTTNLSFFDSSQKSELFRLKAFFLASLGGRSKANQAYCHAVQICPSYARAWASWGGLCSSLGDLTEKQREQRASSASSEGDAVRKLCRNWASHVRRRKELMRLCFHRCFDRTPLQQPRKKLPSIWHSLWDATSRPFSVMPKNGLESISPDACGCLPKTVLHRVSFVRLWRIAALPCLRGCGFLGYHSC